MEVARLVTTMHPEWQHMLAQAPVVAAFVWFSLRMQKNQQAYLKERNAALEKAMDGVAKHLETTSANLVLLNERVLRGNP